MNWHWFVVAAAALVGVILLLASVESSKSWERFKNDHHCRIVGKKDGQYVLKFGKGSGNWIPGTTTWSCDDGVEYTK